MTREGYYGGAPAKDRCAQQVRELGLRWATASVVVAIDEKGSLECAILI